jgi:hypothetical protein
MTNVMNRWTKGVRCNQVLVRSPWRTRDYHGIRRYGIFVSVCEAGSFCLLFAGKYADDMFEDIGHSAEARKKMAQFVVGPVSVSFLKFSRMTLTMLLVCR